MTLAPLHLEALSGYLDVRISPPLLMVPCPICGVWHQRRGDDVPPRGRFEIVIRHSARTFPDGSSRRHEVVMQGEPFDPAWMQVDGSAKVMTPRYAAHVTRRPR